MQMVIMAGGLATRMRPLTQDIPKSLLPVNNRPFIDYQLNLFSKNGVSNVLICLGYLGEMIEAFVGDGKKWELKVDYSWEKDQLLGTAGALRNANNKLEDNFLITWGDSYVQLDFNDFYKKHLKTNFKCNIGIFKNSNKWDKSNIKFCGGKIIEYNKNKNSGDMKHIDVGVSALAKEFVELIPLGSSSLDDIWKQLSLIGALGGIEVNERFYEIGSSQGYVDLLEYLKMSK